MTAYGFKFDLGWRDHIVHTQFQTPFIHLTVYRMLPLQKKRF
jgi:hypothetical protein